MRVSLLGLMVCIVFFFSQSLACQHAAQTMSIREDPSHEERGPAEGLIRQTESTFYRVQRVQPNEDVVGVDSHMKTDAGAENCSAVWTYQREPLTTQGMAFYSSVTESNHFQAAEERK